MKSAIRHAKTAAPVRLAIAAVALLLWCGQAEAFVYKVLHNFKESDGARPSGGLIVDGNGNFYGMAEYGGQAGCGISGTGCGTVFQISARGKIVVLYRFKGGPDGEDPVGRLTRDDAGNLYGATSYGGSTACGNIAGCGTVFKLAPDGTHTVLHAFTGGNNDGYAPGESLLLDSAGNLYGTTGYGGGIGCGNSEGCGIVYRLAPDGTMTILYAFQGAADGAQPFAGLLRDDAGNLFGTAYQGGNTACYPFGCGVVFELTADGSEEVLHAFDSKHGFFPDGLIWDAKGNFYGATHTFYSWLYRLSPAGKYNTLFKFNLKDANGTFPTGEVLRDEQGNIFLNNYLGGGGSLECGTDGCGTLFELAKDGTGFPLHNFGSFPEDGMNPIGNLVLVNNLLYGMTYGGGKFGDGTMWVRAL